MVKTPQIRLLQGCGVTLRMLALCMLLPVASRGQTADAPVAGRAEQADAIYRQGIAALQQGDLASARAAFEKAVQLLPRSPEGHNSLGWVLLAQKQVDPAIAQFQAALDVRPDFFQAHLNLSSAYLLKGDSKRAAREGREAVRFAPTESEAYRTLARALDATGDVPAAIKQMRRALELDPGRAELHDELGTLLVRGASTTATNAASVEAGSPGGDPSKDGARAAPGESTETPMQSAEKEYAEAPRTSIWGS
jgi:Tfp pilus assembly protein PilF